MSPVNPPPSTPRSQVAEVEALAELGFRATQRLTGSSQRSIRASAIDALVLDLSDPDQRDLGDYELLELIGKGGMGVVYRARQKSLDREVAVKLLIDGFWASATFIERFRREAKAAARMQHPNIVEIYDTGERDGLNFFSMRLVAGQSLAERLKERGPLPEREAALFLRTTAEAIDYAHRLGVLHLDLKPGNLLLGPNDEPLVADFGLARMVDESHDLETGEVWGLQATWLPNRRS